MTKRKRKGKYLNTVTLDIDEGWDSRAWDKVEHYFVRNRGICSHLIRYHPPYFDSGWIPDKDDPDINDYCKRCVDLMRARESHLDLKRFFQR